MNEQTLSIPHDIEAEQAILGAIIENNDLIDKVIDILTPNSFFKPSHQHIFRTMMELADQNKSIDEVILGDKLKSLGQLDESGGYAYLAELVECVPVNENIRLWAVSMSESSDMRDLIQTTSDIGRKARDPEQSVSDLISEASEKIIEISDRKKTNETQPVKNVLAKAFKTLEKISENPGQMLGLETGFIDLDRLTLGLIPSDLIIIAARPSMGKTALALNIANYLATRVEDKGAHLFISIEMSGEQLAFRLLSSEARIETKKLRTGDLQGEDWDKLAMATDKISGSNLHINDIASSVQQITAAVRKLSRSKHGIASLWVDYLQIMDPPKRLTVREQQISYFSQSLKKIAKRFDIPVIALSQLNRDVEKRNDKRGRLSDLRESGAIEQDADIIMFIYRDEVYNDDSPDKGIAEINIAKHRNGPTGGFRLAFIGKHTKFANLSRQEP